jgi:hypothetical protein
MPHAEELGTRKIGTGERPRLRFDLAEVSERIAALDSSQAGSARGSTAIDVDSRMADVRRGFWTPPTRRRRVEERGSQGLSAEGDLLFGPFRAPGHRPARG